LGYGDATLVVLEDKDEGQAVGTRALACPAAADVPPRSQLYGRLDGLVLVAVAELSPEPLAISPKEPPAAAVEEPAASFEGLGVGGKAEEIVGGSDQELRG
jgi:hypothetical protein